MNIFGIGLPEMGLIMIVALLVFGPKKLPEVGRGVAKTLNELKKASKDFENEIKKGTQSLEQSVVTPMKATLEEPKVLAANTVKTAVESTETERVEVAEAALKMPAKAAPETTSKAETVAEAVAEPNSDDQS